MTPMIMELGLVGEVLPEIYTLVRLRSPGAVFQCRPWVDEIL